MDKVLQRDQDGNEKGHLADKASDDPLYHRGYRFCYLGVLPDRCSRLRIHGPLEIISQCSRLKGETMADIEAENKNLEKRNQGEVNAPTEIGEPSEGTQKNIRWYVIHTYSGYENKVQDTLRRKVHSMGMDDTIKEILLPLQEEEEEKDGKTRMVARKVFPGYLLIRMEVNDKSWYVVRNTPGVTGFVGTTTKPIPLSDEEAEKIIHGIQKEEVHVNVKAGDRIRITKGVFEDRVATVLEVADDKKKIKADISNFGTTTTIDLEVGQFEPLR